MGSFMANFKGQKAARLQSKGNYDEARKVYAEAYAAGMNDPRLLLAYSVLLIRAYEFEAAKELLVKTQKAPGITAEQKSQLFMNYAVCCFKLGDIQRGIDLLEKQHQRQPTGLIYGTLGCLYVEAGMTEKALSYNQEALAYDDEDPICLDNMAKPITAWWAIRPRPRNTSMPPIKSNPGRLIPCGSFPATTWKRETPPQPWRSSAPPWRAASLP